MFKLPRLLHETKGQAATEYGIIIAVIAMSAISLFLLFSGKLQNIFEVIKNTIVGV